jgi:hypothetical protein
MILDQASDASGEPMGEAQPSLIPRRGLCDLSFGAATVTAPIRLAEAPAVTMRRVSSDTAASQSEGSLSVQRLGVF